LRGKLEEIEKNQGSACSDKIRAMLKRPLFNWETKIYNNKHSLTKKRSKMTGAWLLTNNLKQISDCTGGRIGDAVRYCQSEQIKEEIIYRNGKI
jgi:hypothetical protein